MKYILLLALGLLCTDLRAETWGRGQPRAFGSFGPGTSLDTPSSVTDGTIVLFDGTDGQGLRAGTGTGLVKAVSGVVSFASLVNADVSNTAAIAYSKLNLASSIVNADVSNSAAIAYSKLALTNSVTNADISNTAAIAYSKLNLAASIVNADINDSAALARSKLATGTANRVVVNDGSGVLSESSITTTTLGYLDATSSIQTQLDGKQETLTPGSISTSTTGVTVGSGSSSTVGPNVTINVQTASGSQPGLLSSADWTTFNSKQAALPSQSGHSGEFLTTDGSVLSWAAVPATTPGGADTSIQYNNGGSFAGFGTYDGSLLTIPTTKVGAQLGVGALPRTDSATYSNVNPVYLSGTNQIGVYVDQAFSSAATGGINGYSVNLTQAAGITTSFAINFSAGGMIKGSGSTITRALNFFGSIPTVGTNNVWGSDNVSFTGDYVLNFASTNPSFFAGPIVLDGLTASRAVVTDGSKNLSSSATTSTQLAYLSSATGTTGTASSNLVFSASPTLSGTVTMPSGSVTSSAWSTGTSTLDVGGTLLVRKDNNGVNRLQIRNDDTGSSAYSQLKLSSDQGDLNFNVNSGAAGDSIQITADSTFAGGFQIGILGTNSLSLATNGTTAVNFDSNQKMILATSGNGQFHQIYGRGLNISYNSSTTGYVALANANGGAGFDATAGSSTGDAFFATNISGVSWTFGQDRSDGSAWILSNSSALGSSNAIRVATTTFATTFSGSVGVRTAPTTSSHLIVGGSSQLSTTTQYGVQVNPVISSSATAGVYGIGSELTVANASFTVPWVLGFAAANISAVGGTATITRAVGYYSSVQSGGTNNAVIADNLSFTGNYFINSTSTNSSLFSGVVNASAGVRTKYSTANVTDGAPTAAEMASACGTAASGLTCVINDNNGGTSEFFVWSDGTNWFWVLGTKGL